MSSMSILVTSFCKLVNEGNEGKFPRSTLSLDKGSRDWLLGGGLYEELRREGNKTSSHNEESVVDWKVHGNMESLQINKVIKLIKWEHGVTGK